MDSHYLCSVESSFLDNHIVFYDGDCGFCNASVQWVLPRDKNSVFKFAPLQSAMGVAFKKQLHLPEDYTNSIIVWDAQEQKGYIKSDAAKQICKYLPGYRWAYGLMQLIPRFVRDGVYAIIARYRHLIKKNDAQCNLQYKLKYQDRFWGEE